MLFTSKIWIICLELLIQLLDIIENIWSVCAAPGEWSATVCGSEILLTLLIGDQLAFISKLWRITSGNLLRTKKNIRTL